MSNLSFFNQYAVIQSNIHTFMASQRLTREVENSRLATIRQTQTMLEMMIPARATQLVSDAPNSPPSMTAAMASTGFKSSKTQLRSRCRHAGFQRHQGASG